MVTSPRRRRDSLRLLIMAALVATVGHGVAAAANPAPAQGKIDPARLIWWSADEQAQAFKRFDSLYATRLIRRGASVTPLPQGKLADIEFSVDGKNYDTTSFMHANLVAGVLVLKNGAIVTERYDRGLQPNERWASFSVEKSFVGTLIGAAVQDGSIASVQTPASQYVLALRRSPLQDVTIQNFLQMSSGMQWNEDYQNSTDIDFIVATWAGRRTGTLLPYIAAKPRAWPPGSRYEYNSANTQVLVEVAAAATHQKPSEYLSQKIWKPLGMEQDANWELDGDGGMEAGSISATLRDYGRFGLFIANGGLIGGARVLPQDWMEQATTGSTVNPKYGYQWWLDGGGAFSARGMFGQVIYIHPRSHLVIVILENAVSAQYDPAAQARVSAFLRAAESVLGTGETSSQSHH